MKFWAAAAWPIELARVMLEIVFEATGFEDPAIAMVEVIWSNGDV